MFFFIRADHSGSRPEPRKPRKNIFFKGWKPTRANVATVKMFLTAVHQGRRARKTKELEAEVSRWSPEYPEALNRVERRARILHEKEWLDVILKVVMDDFKFESSLERNKIIRAFHEVLEAPPSEKNPWKDTHFRAQVESVTLTNGVKLGQFLRKVEAVQRALKNM